MIYRLLADLVLITHFCFVIFVIFGGLLVLRHRWILWLHVPAFVWGVLIEWFLFACPLTSLENYLRVRGGEAGYEGGFVEHFVSSILYLQITPQIQILLGVFLLAFNLIVYFLIFRRRRTLA